MSLDRITRAKILAERRAHKERIRRIRIERHLKYRSRPPAGGRQLFMDVA